MAKRKTDKEFKQEVFNLVGDEYTFLDNYVNTRTKTKVKHNKCGNVYEVTPNAFLRGRRCPYCSRKKTNIQFRQEAYNLVGNEYVFLDQYFNAYTKIRVKHNKCGNIYKVRPNSFLHGERYPYCFGTPKKTNREFKQEILDLVGDEYVFLEPYQGANTKLKVKHNRCGNIYKVTPTHFINHHTRCPYCAGYIKKD